MQKANMDNTDSESTSGNFNNNNNIGGVTSEQQKKQQHEVKFTNSRDYYNYKYSDTLAHDNHLSGATAINSKYSSNLPLIVKYCSKEWKALQQKKGQLETTAEERHQNWFNFINCIGSNFCSNTEYPHFKECMKDFSDNITSRNVQGISSNNDPIMAHQQLVSIESLTKNTQDHAKHLTSKEKRIECLQMMKACISRIFPSSITLD